MSKKFEHLSQGEYVYVEQEIAAAKRSLYFWWWKYLRLSKDYWWLCKEGGKSTDKRFVETYKKFGDVFQLSFEDWWVNHGALLFAMNIHPFKIEWANNTLLWKVNQARWLGVIVVPLYKTKSELRKQFADLIKSHTPKGTDAYRPEVSSSDMNNLKGIRKQVLKDAHRVWCINEALTHLKAVEIIESNQKFTQYWIGKKASLGLRRDYDRYKLESYKKNEQLTLRVKVNRYIAKANCLISNVEVGSFPNFTSPIKVKRWTKRQESELASAIAAGEWKSTEFINEEIFSLFNIEKLMA